MKKIFTKHRSYSSKTTMNFTTLLSSLKIIGVIREMEHWIGIRIVPLELTNLNEYSTALSQRLSKNYQPHHKKSSFVCVSSCANAYNYSHNEIAANIEKCQKLSEARWNDGLIEYICNN